MKKTQDQRLADEDLAIAEAQQRIGGMDIQTLFSAICRYPSILPQLQRMADSVLIDEVTEKHKQAILDLEAERQLARDMRAQQELAAEEVRSALRAAEERKAEQRVLERVAKAMEVADREMSAMKAENARLRSQVEELSEAKKKLRAALNSARGR